MISVINIARGILLWIILTNLLFLNSPAFASQIISEWKSTSGLPYTLASHTAYSFNDRVFIVGGAADIGIPSYIYAQADSSGMLSSWTSLAPFSRFWHAGVMEKNFYYVLGGANYPPTAFSESVSVGTIEADGQIHRWSSLNSLPHKSALGGTTIIENRIYFAGGFYDANGSTVIHKNIYFADTFADGTIGEWKLAGFLPEPLYAFGMVSHNKSLIIVGGYNGTRFSANTYKADFNLDGTIASWQSLNPLPEPSYRSATIKVGTTLHVIGGTITSIANKVYSAALNADATISEWSLNANKLPKPMWGNTASVVKNNIFLIGGYNGGYIKDVFYAQLEIDTPATLPVPYFNQNELPWGTQEYDHTKLLGLKNETMDRWGCAVTSAAMILKFHGMNEMPDGKEITPESLNEWLKNNNGYSYGYNKTGWYSGIRWNAISSLSKELYDTQRSSRKLEFVQATKKDTLSDMLDNDLTQGNEFGAFPDILHVTQLADPKTNIGHYIVATGKLDNTYAINDPEWNLPLLENFENEYDQLIRYVPSQTDLSYLDFMVNPNIEILVIDPHGKRSGKIIRNGETQAYDEIANANYTFTTPIANPDVQGVVEQAGTGFNHFLLPKPQQGSYTITLTSIDPTDYTISMAEYQKDGDVSTNVINGLITNNQNDSITITYMPNVPSTHTRNVTFESTLADIAEASNLGLITTNGTTKALSLLIQEAQKFHQQKKGKQETKILQTFEAVLTSLKQKVIKQQAYEILLYDIQALRQVSN